MSALNIGFTLIVKSYNYHIFPEPLNGNLYKAKNTKDPLKTLLTIFCSVDDLNIESLNVAINLLNNDRTNTVIPQIGATSFQLAAVVTPLIIYHINNSYFPEVIRLDLSDLIYTLTEKSNNTMVSAQLKNKLREMLKQLR